MNNDKTPKKFSDYLEKQMPKEHERVYGTHGWAMKEMLNDLSRQLHSLQRENKELKEKMDLVAGALLKAGVVEKLKQLYNERIL